MTSPFDRVVIHDGTQERTFTVSEFLALPLPERIRYILGRQLAFFRGRESVEVNEALRLMREMTPLASR
jgi:hypothetical protein